MSEIKGMRKVIEEQYNDSKRQLGYYVDWILSDFRHIIERNDAGKDVTGEVISELTSSLIRDIFTQNGKFQQAELMYTLTCSTKEE